MSAVSVAPGGEAFYGGMMLAIGFFLVGWAVLAFWARRQLRSAGSAALPAGAKAAVITVGAVYVLLVLLCSVG